MNGLVPLLLIGAVLLFIVLALQNVRPGRTAKLPVEAKPLMSATERQIIALLEEALPQARVHAKVAMGAIVKTRAGLSQRQRMSVRGRFSQKIVDFVLEDRASGRILALVEHGNGARKAASERSGTRSPARPVTRPSACPTRAGQRPPASATSCWPPFRPRRIQQHQRPSNAWARGRAARGDRMTWQFDEMGEFGSEADADRWAKRNNIAPQDVRITRKGEGVELEVRRSALGDSGSRHNDRRDGRRNGFF